MAEPHPAHSPRVVSWLLLASFLAAHAVLAQPRQVLDLRPGPDSGLYPAVAECFPTPLPRLPPLPTASWSEPLGASVIFGGDDGLHGRELWRSDGTPEGTVLIADLLPGAPSGLGRCPTFFHGRLGGRVLLVADDGTHGFELWASDGTAEGTALVADLSPGPESTSLVRPFEVVGDDAFFAGAALDFRGDLWRTDGTETGTRQVVEPGSGSQPKSPDALTPALGGLLFTATTPEGGREPWFSDGTSAGTGALELVPGPMGSEVLDFSAPAAAHAVMLERRSESLWRTEGTPESTAPFFTFEPSRSLSFLPPAGSRTLVARRPFGADGTELWRSDGTAAGTERVGDFQFVGGIGSRGQVRGVIVFEAETMPGERGLWRTDGTASGTFPLIRFAPPPPLVASIPWLVDLPGARLGVAVRDGAGAPALWITDGTTAGTAALGTLCPAGEDCQPDAPAVAGTTLFFSALGDAAGRELWTWPLAGALRPSVSLGPNDRFVVEVRWQTPDGRVGPGTPERLSADTGTFSFFDPANLELMVKILDGRNRNGHFWVFYGALSNVAFTITITDTETGAVKEYRNDQGAFGSVGDTNAFAAPLTPAPSAAGPDGGLAFPDPASIDALSADPPAQSVPFGCATTVEGLCLQASRFSVAVTWTKPDGESGSGKAVGMTEDTGSFWFFQPSNLELMVKVLDGRNANGHFWVFYGALSNVEYTITVTDTATGAVEVYHNPPGRFASVGDTRAFAQP